MSTWGFFRKKFFKGHLICHGCPERSFKIKGHQMPVCARCTGLYLGSFSYIMLILIFNWGFNLILFLAGFLLIVPTLWDGVTQYFNLRTSNNKLRLITGILGGVGLGIIITSIRFLV